MVLSTILWKTLKLYGTDDGTKTDEFYEKFQGGEVIFNPKIYIADFGPLYRALNRDFRGKLQYDFPRVREESEGHLEFFRKFIRFGSAICL